MAVRLRVHAGRPSMAGSTTDASTWAIPRSTSTSRAKASSPRSSAIATTRCGTAGCAEPSCPRTPGRSTRQAQAADGAASGHRLDGQGPPQVVAQPAQQVQADPAPLAPATACDLRVDAADLFRCHAVAGVFDGDGG